MATSILAHFDGVVLVPDEPINVPAGTPLRVSFEPVGPTIAGAQAASGAKSNEPVVASIVDRLPLVRGLDANVVRSTIDDFENDLGNVDADAFLFSVKAASVRNQSE